MERPIVNIVTGQAHNNAFQVNKATETLAEHFKGALPKDGSEPLLGDLDCNNKELLNVKGITITGTSGNVLTSDALAEVTALHDATEAIFTQVQEIEDNTTAVYNNTVEVYSNTVDTYTNTTNVYNNTVAIADNTAQSVLTQVAVALETLTVIAALDLGATNINSEGELEMLVLNDTTTVAINADGELEVTN